MKGCIKMIKKVYEIVVDDFANPSPKVNVCIFEDIEDVKRKVEKTFPNTPPEDIQYHMWCGQICAEPKGGMFGQYMRGRIHIIHE